MARGYRGTYLPSIIDGDDEKYEKRRIQNEEQRNTLFVPAVALSLLSVVFLMWAFYLRQDDNFATTRSNDYRQHLDHGRNHHHQTRTPPIQHHPNHKVPANGAVIVDNSNPDSEDSEKSLRNHKREEGGSIMSAKKRIAQFLHDHQPHRGSRKRVARMGAEEIFEDTTDTKERIQRLQDAFEADHKKVGEDFDNSDEQGDAAIEKEKVFQHVQEELQHVPH